MAKKKNGKSDKAAPAAEVESVVKSKTYTGNAQDRIARLLGREAFKKLSADHGNLILTRASDERVAKSFRIPSGVFPLDQKLGGGWAQGRVITIFGMKSTGKTTLLIRTIASAQRMCSNCWVPVRWSHQVEKDEEVIDEKTGEVTKVLDPKTKEPKKVKVWEPVWVKRWWADTSGKWRVMLKGELKKVVEKKGDKEVVAFVPDVTLGEELKADCDCGKYREAVCSFIDVEGTFDKQWAMRQGVDLLKLMLSQPEVAEQSLDIADALVRSGECDILVLDSIAFLTPKKEITSSTEQILVGEQARTVGKGTRKFVSGINAVALHSERRPTIFLTNQIRMKVGVMFGNPETQPGGLAPGFASSVEVKTKGGTYTYEKQDKDAEEKDRIPLEVELNFDVEKNKAGVAKRQGSFKLVLIDGETKKKGDVYDEDALMAEAEKVGLIKKGNKGWTCLGETFTAKSHIDRRLLTDPLFSQTLRWATLRVIVEADKMWADDEPVAPTPEEAAAMEAEVAKLVEEPT